MKAPAPVPIVDTTIVPDRNAGMGSLLWDLQNPADHDVPPLLDREFAFIDVGVSRACPAIALFSLLSQDLGLDVDYVATERPEAVPYAHVTPLGTQAERIRSGLNRMISSKGGVREVADWHFTVDSSGKVASIAYRYDLHGNQIWESYPMGRPFLHAGATMEFSDPDLDSRMAPVVAEIEARMDREPPAPCWRGYRVEIHPLETQLAKSGVTLQKTDTPHRIEGRQNVLFLGNVLNNYPPQEQARELDGISDNMAAGDLIIIQVDDVESAFIDVLQVKTDGKQRTRERVRWINTRTLEIHATVTDSGSWLKINLKPELDRMFTGVIASLGASGNSLARQIISQVFRSFFRAMPMEKTARIGLREISRRLSPMQEELIEIASPRHQPENEKQLINL